MMLRGQYLDSCLHNAIIDNVVLTTIPIPAAIWLFGSGIIGLIGIARRKTRN